MFEIIDKFRKPKYAAGKLDCDSKLRGSDSKYVEFGEQERFWYQDVLFEILHKTGRLLVSVDFDIRILHENLEVWRASGVRMVDADDRNNGELIGGDRMMIGAVSRN
jgi:hypothetical protein